MMMWGYGPVAGPGWGWVGMIIMFLFWVAVIALAAWAVAALASPRVRWREDEAIELLRRRYASGEISEEQYLQMLQTLRKG
ncbi:MAG: SHOCT domain-containing protein [Clostridia bacterium]|nr:SHOCT domain-containing protein [Clostridia bacterium]